jgi:hypothetical protein
MGKEGLFLVCRWPECKARFTFPGGVEVKNEWIFLPLSHKSSLLSFILFTFIYIILLYLLYLSTWTTHLNGALHKPSQQSVRLSVYPPHATCQTTVW